MKSLQNLSNSSCKPGLRHPLGPVSPRTIITKKLIYKIRHRICAVVCYTNTVTNYRLLSSSFTKKVEFIATHWTKWNENFGAA